MIDTILETKDLSFNYGKNMILRDLNINVPRGSVYGYLGRNGSGKTTTISLIFKLLKANSGAIFYDGKDIAKLKHHYFGNVSMLSQPLSLYSHLTAIEQIDYIRCFYGFKSSEIDQALRDVEMYDSKKVKIKHMSAGMKQRLAIAISLLQNSELLVLDEPINGLDPNGIHEFRELIGNLNKQGKTIFLSSHILGEMQKICSHIGILGSGNLLLQDSISNINKLLSSKIKLHTSNNEQTRELLQNSKFAESVELVCGNLFCKIQDDSEYAKVINLISSKAIDIYNIDREHTDLETIYLTLTKQP